LGDIFQEVDEELRKDRFEKLWKEYGRYAVGTAVAVVVAAGAWKGWEFYSSSQRLSASQQYEVAGRLLSESKKTDARALFSGLTQEGYGQYKTLAAFRNAALLGNDGDIAGAVAAYAKISGDSSTSKMFRDAATLFSVMYRMDQSGADAAALLQELAPLRDAEGAWRFSAGEMAGLLEIRMGELTAARKTFQALADDLNAPEGLRGRATQILAVIGQS